jgi:leucyl aminopeptidase
MPIRLPLSSLLVPVRQLRAPPTESTFTRHACVVVLLPASADPNVWNTLPLPPPVRDLYRRKPRKPGDIVQIRIGARAQTLVVAACLAPAEGTFEMLRAAGRIARAALEGEPETLLVCAGGGAEFAPDTAMHAMVAALQAAAFQFATFKSEPKPHRPPARIDLAARKLSGLDVTLATSAGNNLARWLTALPPNTLDAAGYRRLLAEFARRLGLGFKFYGEPQLRRLGAGAFLAVSQGNATRDAGIVHLAFRPKAVRAGRAHGARAGLGPLSLVGKGICFDTGGTNLKTHKSMLDMHIDMEGSAVAVGSLYALHALRTPIPVDCWLAITENRIGPLAYKPQDVVRALNGTTIQVIHTDAEGRMVLADTLCLAARVKPRAIIDYATLTGACVYALTERYSGAFTNRPELRDAIEAAGSASGERVWCFPMDKDFDSDLESTVADVMQCAVEGKGDHILAARFLSRFVPKTIPWLHVDLAAGSRAGGLAHIATDITGFGVRFTIELIGRGWPFADAATRRSGRGGAPARGAAAAGRRALSP